MEYFSQFPQTVYTFDSANNDFVAVVNILDRTKFLSQVLSQGLVFYPYSFKDSDKAEIIADKYYNDPKRHWIVMYANQIIDPYNDFPLNQTDFNNNIVAQYGSSANAQANLHHVEMRTTTVTASPQGTSNTITVATILKDPYVYNFATKQVQAQAMPTIGVPTINMGSNTALTSDGSTVTISQVLVAVNALDYQTAQNEVKRVIQLVDQQYAGAIETELHNLFQQ